MPDYKFSGIFKQTVHQLHNVRVSLFYYMINSAHRLAKSDRSKQLYLLPSVKIITPLSKSPYIFVKFDEVGKQTWQHF